MNARVEMNVIEIVSLESAGVDSIMGFNPRRARRRMSFAWSLRRTDKTRERSSPHEIRC